MKRRSNCVFGCAEFGVNMHRFPHPVKRPEMNAKWISIVGDKLQYLDPQKIYKNKRVCDLHFRFEDKVACHRLLGLAVPCLYLNGVFASAGLSVQLEHSYAITRPSAPLGTSEESNLTPTQPLSNEENTSGTYSKSATEKSATADAKDIDTITPKVPTEVDDLHTLGDGIIDDDDSPPSLVLDMETSSAEPLFSWETSELIPADEPQAVICEDVPQDPSGVSFYCDNVTSQDAPAKRVPSLSEPVPREVEYRCKECGETIKGFQFWCVQCVGCALCAACEARGAHNAHYVLRAPPHRPHRQTQVVLAAIRHQLQNENMLTALDTGDGRVKLEVKEEPIEEEVTMITQDVPGADPLAAPDPLETSVSDDDDESRHNEENEGVEEITEPQSKRARFSNFIEKDFVVPEKPKVIKKPLPVKETRTAPSQKIIDLDEFEDVQYLNTEELDNLETSTKSLENIETNTKELENLENSNDILGDADMNIVVKRGVTNDDNDSLQILGNVDNNWIVQRGVDKTEDTLPRRVRGPQVLMARNLTRKAVVKLQPLSSVEIRKWTVR